MDVDELAARMSTLAKEAGDWREHLPYEAAVRFVGEARFQEMYGPHVEACRYCRRLVDALHPPKAVEDDLVIVALQPTKAAGVRAATEALVAFDWSRPAVLAQSVGSGKALWQFSAVQKALAEFSEAVEGPTSVGPVSWSDTVALSFGNAVAGGADVGNPWIGTVAADLTHFLVGFGYRVAHAGDLDVGGISERLFQVGRPFGRREFAEHEDMEEEAGYGVLNYCAWPVHMGMERHEFEIGVNNLSRIGMVNCLTLEGESRPYKDFIGAVRRKPKTDEWSKGWAALRNRMVHDSCARIAIGGWVDAETGGVPSLVSDALVSLRNEHPLFVLGGFGGCAGEVAAALCLTERSARERQNLSSLAAITDFSGWECLHNGLDGLENRQLAETDDVKTAMELVLKGLDRLAMGG